MPPGRRPVGGGASSPVYDTVRRGLAESMFDTAKQALRDEQQRRRSQALRTGFAPAPAEEPKKENPWLGALKGAAGLTISPLATVSDIAWKPFELIPGAPDFNPEDAGSVNLFVQGGKSLQHVYGDAKELARSIITGEDTLSQSPTARAYQAAGGGLEGALVAAAPYLDLASVAAPVAMGAARGAGVVAPKAVPYKPLTNADIPNTSPYTYGVHISPNPDLQVVSPRTAGAAQVTAGDAMAGSSYMWDAQSPRLQDLFQNPQMNRNAADVFSDVAAPESYAYITRAPARNVFQDANVPGSAALRVAGPQEILERVPFTSADLAEALASRNITPRSAAADALEARYRGLSPVVKADVADRPLQLAEEALRRTIASGPNPYMSKNFPGLFDLDPNASLPELLRNPDARRYFEASRGVDMSRFEAYQAKREK